LKEAALPLQLNCIAIETRSHDERRDEGAAGAKK
jgi:hypothetical protein